MMNEEKSSCSPTIMRRWRVCRACDGYMFEFDLKQSDDVETLQRAISKRTEIGVKEQIVLYGPPYKRLLKTKPLRRAVGKDIFVFDRRHLTKKNLPLVPVDLNPRTPAFPVSKKKGGEKKKNIKGTSPMLRVLHDYSKQFEHSLDTARAILTVNSERIRACVSSLKRQNMIRKAWEAASTNLQEHCDTSVRKFREFNRSFREEQERQSEVLESFDAALEKLCEIRLHREIRDVGRLTLIDLIPVTRLKTWASELKRSQRRLELKVAELSEIYLATSDGVRGLNVPLKLTLSKEKEEGEEDTTWSVSEFGQDEREDDDGDDDRLSGNRSDELRRNVQVLRSSLETLHERVVGTLESDLSNISEMMRTTIPSTTSLQDKNHARDMVRDLCNKLETTHRVHQDELRPQLHAMDTSVMCALSTCAQHHTHLMERMRDKMYLVSVLQSRIRDQGVRLAAIRAALDQQKDGIEELDHVRNMPKAYVASLREVAKRRAYKKRYVKEMEKFSERMARMVQAETLRRDIFVKNHYVHLPQNLIPDLKSRPSHCQIRTREFDSQLPNIKHVSSQELIELCGGTSYDFGDDHDGVLKQHHSNDDSGSEDEIVRLRNELESQKNLCEKYETRIKILEQRLADDTLEASSSSSQSCSELVLSLKKILDHHDEKNILDRVRELQMTELKYKDMLSEVLLVMQSDGNDTESKTVLENSSSNDVVPFLTKLSSRQNLLRADLQHRDSEIEKLKKVMGTKLSFHDFAVNDVALFLPAKVYYDVERTIYVAFHRSCPRRFLSDESVDQIICKNGNRAPDFILGRITRIDVKVAISSRNDFSVPLGETYSLLDVVELDVNFLSS